MPASPARLVASDPPIVRALTAGGLYFLIALGTGFALGVVRELLVAPRLTSDLAVVLETPVMAVAVWFAAGFAVRRLHVPAGFGLRLAMGALALALLLGAEALLSQALRGESLLGRWALYGYFAAAANLGGLSWFTFAPLCIAPPDAAGSPLHA